MATIADVDTTDTSQPTRELTSGEVAKRGRVSRERVYKLDARLKPRRDTNGSRWYDPAVVEEWLVEREAKTEARRAKWGASAPRKFTLVVADSDGRPLYKCAIDLDGPNNDVGEALCALPSFLAKLMRAS